MSKNSEVFSFVHLSDLHCSDGNLHLFCPSHTHDSAMLQGVERILNQLAKGQDRVLVTGDLTNYGDPASFRFARMWLMQTVALPRGGVTGLRLPLPQLRIIPGNHDAWDNEKTGKVAIRIQRAITNFNNEFPEHLMPRSGVYYDYIDKGGDGVYLVFVNSCHLGDEDDYEDSDRVGIKDLVARGRVTLKQSEEVLTLHEMGLHGRLETPGISGTHIPADQYARSLKLLVMHHYIFPPSGTKKQGTLDMRQAKKVFRNLAYADFDALLCGHKHFSTTCPHKYGDHFDDRALHRYAWNCFRSHLGLSALPDQYSDDAGSFWNRATSRVINLALAALAALNGGRVAGDHLDALCTTLIAALENPEDLEETITEYSKRITIGQAATIDENEVRELRRRLRVNFTRQQRNALKPICERILRKVRRISDRRFVQIVSGSTVKAVGPRGPFHADSRRSFNRYMCKCIDGKWQIVKHEYQWQHETGNFEGPIAYPPQEFDRE